MELNALKDKLKIELEEEVKELEELVKKLTNKLIAKKAMLRIIYNLEEIQGKKGEPEKNGTQ